jgi:hypothetical protein
VWSARAVNAARELPPHNHATAHFFYGGVRIDLEIPGHSTEI